MSNDTIQERVARGAAWLDEVRPGWRDAIELDAFAIEDACACVCGQVFATPEQGAGYYAAEKIAAAELGVAEPAHLRRDEYDPVWEWACSHGFHNPAAEDKAPLRKAEWAALTAEWRRVIHQGRVAAEQREAVAHEC